MGEHDRNTEPPRDPQLVQTEARDKTVDVQDIRTKRCQPAMEQLGTANHGDPLRLVASRRRWDGISKDWSLFVEVFCSAITARFGCSDIDVVPSRPCPPAQTGNIHFGSAETLRIVPADGVDDLHACSLACGKGVPAAVTRLGRRVYRNHSPAESVLCRRR